LARTLVSSNFGRKPKARVATFVYNASKAHHMIPLILDQCFKTLDMVKVLVGRSKLVAMLPKYDNKTLLPFLIVVFYFLNVGAFFFANVGFSSFDQEDFIFGHVISNVDHLQGLLKTEFSLFCHLHVHPKDYKLFLTW
jgi:hypothetical protein